MQGDTDRSTLLIAEFNTPLPVQYRSIGRNIVKDIEGVNNIINKADLIDLY